MSTASGLDWPETPCCIKAAAGECICGKEERALRGFMAGRIKDPMTAEQREYCLSQIDQIEGYSRAEYASTSDPDLAHGVLSAWVDYCRDKGVL